MKLFRPTVTQLIALLIFSFFADAASCCTDTHAPYIRIAGNDTRVNEWEVVLFNIDTTNLAHEQIVQDCKMMLRLTRSSTHAISEVTTKGNTLEIELNTAATPPKTGNLNPIMLQRTFLPAANPWARSGSLFAHTNVTVNSFRTVDRAVAYVQMVLLVLDQQTNRQFWISVQIWDPRGFESVAMPGWPIQKRNMVMTDKCKTCTGLPNFLTSIDDENVYLRKSDASSNSFSTVDGHTRHIAFELRAKDLEEIISALRSHEQSLSNISSQPDDYSLKMAAIEVEAWTDAPSSVSLGVILNDWGVEFR
jgi:hypothetical protein